jgi:LPXTG-motif cell wall-anchored protein
MPGTTSDDWTNSVPLNSIEKSVSGLGSSNSIFTVAILCLTVLLMLPALFLIIRRKKLGWLFFTINLMFAGIFGWLLPLLTHWR